MEGVEVGGEAAVHQVHFRSNQKSETRDAGAQLSLPFLFSIQSETLACRMAPPTLRVVLLASQIHPQIIPKPVRLSTTSSEGDNSVLWDPGCPMFEHGHLLVITLHEPQVCALCLN